MCGLGTQQILRLTRVAKFIAHEVEVALAAQGQCDHADLRVARFHNKRYCALFNTNIA